MATTATLNAATIELAISETLVELNTANERANALHAELQTVLYRKQALEVAIEDNQSTVAAFETELVELRAQLASCSAAAVPAVVESVSPALVASVGVKASELVASLKSVTVPAAVVPAVVEPVVEPTKPKPKRTRTPKAPKAPKWNDTATKPTTSDATPVAPVATVSKLVADPKCTAMQISIADLSKICYQVSPCCDDASTRYSLAAVQLVVSENEIVATATDGKRLAQLTCAVVNAVIGTYMISGRDLRKISIAKSAMGNAALNVNADKSITVEFKISSRTKSYTCAAVDGRFPNADHILADVAPSKSKGQATIVASQWAAEWTEYTNSQCYSFSINGTVNCKAKYTPNFRRVKHTGADIQTDIDMAVLCNHLGTYAEGLEVEMSYVDSTRPIRLDCGRLTYIQMPMGERR